MRKAYKSIKGHAVSNIALYPDGIWGEVGKNINANDALALGCTMGTILKSKDQSLIVIGRDNRLTSVILEDEFCRGLAATGCYVMIAGVSPLPAIQFSAYYLQAASVMISGGSHHQTINGFQLFIDQNPVRGDRLKRLVALAANGSWNQSRGGALHGNIIEIYHKKMIELVKTQRPLKIAWDLCGGTACQIIPSLSDAVKGEHLLMNEESDPTFGEILPDAFAPERVEVMKEVVRSENCHAGFIINGDCTQISLVDDSGMLWTSEQLFEFLLKCLISKHKDSTVMVNMSTSLNVMNALKKMGNPIGFAQSGTTALLQHMIMQNGIFGSDGNGRFAFGYQLNHVPCYDAIYTAVTLMNILSERTASLSEEQMLMPNPMLRQEKYYAHPKPKELVVSIRLASLKENFTIVDIDGVRLEQDDCWCWIHEDPEADHPRIELIFEGASTVVLNQLIGRVEAILKHIGGSDLKAEKAEDKRKTAPERNREESQQSSLKKISDEEREDIDFVSRHWQSLRKKVDHSEPEKARKRVWSKKPKD